MDQWALIGVRSGAVHLLCLLVDQVEELDRVMVGDQLFHRVVLCGRQHLGPCWRRDDIARTCYHCGGRGHIARNCPSQTVGVGGSVASGTQAKAVLGVVAEELKEAEAEVEVLATEIMTGYWWREEAPASNDVISDLIVMDLKEFDVILGMDWLAQHRAVVDCYKKEVMIESSGESRVVFVGDRQVVPICVISAVEARRLMLEGCEAYLAHVIDTKKVNPTLEEIPVVRDFPEVFPDDLPVCHHIEK
ncbi:UNVERIFIED_CONTAM: hypothetical protein Slati_2496800 [Sesamum latifolium]|uniref:CCHC-type domain-containing protein n=1 Tax=Sesamum latifolium TaxID=2727402 RepID=A0AAW2WFD1_9LAMI